MKTLVLCSAASLVAALAAASCYDSIPFDRYPGTNDGDGHTDADADNDVDTDTDTNSASNSDEVFTEWCDAISGLCWQDPAPGTRMTLVTGCNYCAGAVIEGHGDWRLPSVSELRSLIRGCPSLETGGECPITDELDWDGATEELCNGQGTVCPPHEGYYWAPELTDTYWECGEDDDCGIRSTYKSSSYIATWTDHGRGCDVDFSQPYVDCSGSIKTSTGEPSVYNGQDRIRCVRTAP